MKLKWKISLPILTLLLISTMTTTILNYTMTRNSINQIVENTVRSNLDTLTSLIIHAEDTEQVIIDEMSKRNLALTRAFSEVIAFGISSGELDLNDSEYFQRIAGRLGVTEINVTDHTGDIVGSNFADYIGWNYGSADSTAMYLRIIDDPTYEIVEGVRADAISGNMLQYLGVARSDAKGFVQMGFDANLVQEFHSHLDISGTVAKMQVGSTGHAAHIVDGIVIHSHNSGLIGQDVSDIDWFRQVSSGSATAWMDIDGSNYYTGYENIGDTTLLVMFPRAEYDAYLTPVIITTVVGIIVAAIITTITFVLVNHMLKPLVPLTAYMNKASTTGDIELGPEDIKVIGRFAAIKDELGQCIGACASFIGRITEVSQKLGIVADGDLTVQIDPLSNSDVLGVSLNRMNERLNQMFSDIQTTAVEVSRGSKQTADGSHALAQGSTQQAASIEELSASILEIAGKTKANADIAGETSKLADSIRGTAEKGNNQMEEMMEAVKDINQASQSISKIIKVIDDIAFQTNILALNAAVEAARAGQHGKGFAVVAEEVRNLASKSAEAARNTGTMIQDSVNKAEMGSRIASETAASLTEIVAGINESAENIAQIAKSSDEQSSSIEQVTTGIGQVAQVVQQNSATAEESAATSEEMNAQSRLLLDLVTQFKLKEEHQLQHQLPPAYR